VHENKACKSSKQTTKRLTALTINVDSTNIREELLTKIQTRQIFKHFDAH